VAGAVVCVLGALFGHFGLFPLLNAMICSSPAYSRKKWLLIFGGKEHQKLVI